MLSLRFADTDTEFEARRRVRNDVSIMLRAPVPLP